MSLGRERETERGVAGPDETGRRALEYLFETRSALPAPAIAWEPLGRG